MSRRTGPRSHRAVFICGGDERVFPDDTTCPDNADHTHMPRGYTDRAMWADKMLETHDVKRCPSCDLLKIWVPR